MSLIIDNLNLKVKEYYISDEVREKLKKEAINRTEVDILAGFKRRDFKNTKKARYLTDFYGLHGEYAVAIFFRENNINYQVGEKFATDYKKITHDFLILNKNQKIDIGVKTAVVKRYKTINEFFNNKKFGKTLFYPYRGKNARLKGHGYPDLLFFCMYFPEVFKSKIYIIGFVTKNIIKISKITKIYNKDTHLININHFKPCEHSLPILK